jgi:hypothetical protein
MSREGLSSLWRERFERFAADKQNIGAWCEAQGVAVHQFYYWRRRLATAPQTSDNAGAWCVVDFVETAPPAASTAGITLHIGSASIDLQVGFDPSLLRAVVQALETNPC